MQSIKPIVQQISYARQGINEKKNISENIEKMKAAFDQLAPAIRNQQDYIQNMNPSSIQVKDGAEKLQEQKRYFLRFLDLMNYELSELLNIARNILHSEKKSSILNFTKLYIDIIKLCFYVNNRIKKIIKKNKNTQNCKFNQKNQFYQISILIDEDKKKMLSYQIF